MKTTQEDINKRLQALENKIIALKQNGSNSTEDIRKLAREYRTIMDDYEDSLMDSDLDFLMQ